MLYDHILVPFDGSASAQAALAEAVRFAKEDPGLTLHVMQIVDAEKRVIDKLELQGRARGGLSSDELGALYDKVLQEAEAKLHQQVDGQLASLMNPVQVDLLEETVPGTQIVAFAEEHGCDLIIMGSRGLGALRGMLGSVSSHVLRNAPVPVMIVKQP